MAELTILQQVEANLNQDDYSFEVTEDEKKVYELCLDLNKHLPCKSQEDVDYLTNKLDELFTHNPKYQLYWSREIYIDSGFNDVVCNKILCGSGKTEFAPSDDWDEHPGITVCYKYEERLKYYAETRFRQD